jgi:cytochrome c oxidase accessory protein FixG
MTAKNENKNVNEEVVYEKHKKIYPRKVTGTFARLRVIAVALLLGLYYGLPWLNIGGHQSVLFDLPARKFSIFGVVFWPQDFFYMALLLIIAALLLFFVTAVAGRLWCGYACPQTVWTELFLWIEQAIEGDRPKQMKLDKAPWSSDKYIKKGIKHFIWFVLGLWTGLTFVGYFTPIRELVQSALTFSLGPWEIFWILFYGFATWGNAGFMREQVCIYMCPYARFQSAMFDNNTLIISYDEKRGDPRGSRKKGTDTKALGLGDCVDCTLCVQVCPTGIDIRDGLQYQCIGCAACVDVCDEVMEKVGYEKGLVRYTTENALESGEDPRVMRPKVIGYSLIILAFIVGLIVAISQRVPVELDIIKDRNTLYRENGEGMIENVYTLKVINMDKTQHWYDIGVSGIDGIKIRGAESLVVPSGKVLERVVTLEVDPANLPETSNWVVFHIQSKQNPDITEEEKARFLGPSVF